MHPARSYYIVADLISIQDLCNRYSSEDVASNTIFLGNCHLLKFVSIPSGYPFENDEPVYYTQQSDEECDDDMQLRMISSVL
jgi:hypothetical protein